MTKKRTPRDYRFIRLIGEGSFSSVYLAVDAEEPPPPPPPMAQDGMANGGENNTQSASSSSSSSVNSWNKLRGRRRKYAIKVCQKSHIKRQGKQIAIMREKEIMNILNQSPCKHFISLYCTFQDMERLFFVMSYAENGELLTYMLEHPLSRETVQKFTLQLVTALEHLHKLHIVHRDLKPENILLSETLNLLISDFGSAQIYNKPAQQQPTTATTNDNPTNTSGQTNNNNATQANSERRNSFVGTAQYVSPEMLKSREASNKSDLWALGVIVYQMLTNVMPFDAPNEYLIYKKIESLDYKFPDNFDQEARDLVMSLIKLSPDERLGAQDGVATEGYKSIRRHKFLVHVKSESFDRMLFGSTDSEASDDSLSLVDPDLRNLDIIEPGLDETQMLRLLTDG